MVRNERKVLSEINNGAIRKNREDHAIVNNPFMEKPRTSGHTKCFSTVTPVQTKMTENINPNSIQNSIHVRPFDINSHSRENRKALHPDKLTQYLNTIEDIHVRKSIDVNANANQRKIAAPMRTMSISRVIPQSILSPNHTPLMKEVIVSF